MAALVICLAAAMVASRLTNQKDAAPFEPRSGAAEPAQLAPWIDDEKDIETFFPGADNYQTEKHPLSSQQTELAQKLGRSLEPGENLLTFHRVYTKTNPVGAVIVRRVKGEHGALDLVIAISNEEKTKGLKIQRTREPDRVLASLQNPDWLRSMVGRSASSAWGTNDVQELPPEARASAQAIVNGVRSSLILYSARKPETFKPHH